MFKLKPDAATLTLTLAALCAPTFAAPVVFNTAGQTVTISYAQSSFAGTVQYTLDSLGTNTAIFHIVVSNTGSSGAFGGFGVADLTPGLTAVTDTSAAFNVFMDQTFSNGSPSANMEFCARSGGSACDQPGANGLATGTSAAFDVTMTFNASVPPISFGDVFYGRFATTGQNVVTLSGTASAVTMSTAGGGSNADGTVPEPGSLALVAAALLGSAAVRRRGAIAR